VHRGHPASLRDGTVMDRLRLSIALAFMHLPVAPERGALSPGGTSLLSVAQKLNSRKRFRRRLTSDLPATRTADDLSAAGLTRHWCRDPDLDWGHPDFQSTALDGELPTEQPGHGRDHRQPRPVRFPFDGLVHPRRLSVRGVCARGENATRELLWAC
jgi:hypothetical protein